MSPIERLIDILATQAKRDAEPEKTAIKTVNLSPEAEAQLKAFNDAKAIAIQQMDELVKRFKTEFNELKNRKDLEMEVLHGNFWNVAAQLLGYGSKEAMSIDGKTAELIEDIVSHVALYEDKPESIKSPFEPSKN